MPTASSAEIQRDGRVRSSPLPRMNLQLRASCFPSVRLIKDSRSPSGPVTASEKLPDVGLTVARVSWTPLPQDPSFLARIRTRLFPEEAFRVSEAGAASNP